MAVACLNVCGEMLRFFKLLHELVALFTAMLIRSATFARVIFLPSRFGSSGCSPINF